MNFRLKSTALAIGTLAFCLAVPLVCTQLPVLAQIPTPSASKAEADRFLKQGIEQYQTSQFEAALLSWQKALTIYRKLQDRRREGIALSNMGIAYYSLSNYAKAIEYHEQDLAITREIKNRQGEGNALGNLGNDYHALGKYTRAITYHEQHLAIAQESKDRQGEGTALGNLGIAYYRLGNYARALEYYKHALTILRESKNRQGESATLGNLGNDYRALGNYAKAIEYHAQHLAIARESKNRQGEGNALGNLGNDYYSLGNYTKAIEYHEQRLVIAKAINDRQGEGQSLGNLGLAYDALGNYTKAIEYHQQSLAIAREIKNYNGEGSALGNLGIAYNALGDYARAIEYYQQQLAITREINDREGEGISLNNLGYAFAQQKQPELAIAFYKQSVNVREGIRADIRGLSSDLQESYTQSVAGTYRRLADLLLAQGRVLEAQQVLELLKIQELRDYTRSARAGGTTPGIDFDATERKILQTYNTLIDFGQKIRDCQSRKVSCSDAELTQLVQLRNEQTQAIQQILKTLEAELAKRTQQDENVLDPKNDLSRKAQEIIAAQWDTVLIYSLVTDDRLWVVLASEGDILRKFEVKVSQKELTAAVLKFRQLMKDCASRSCSSADVKPVQEVSQKLYNWLLPLELRQELQGKGSRQRPIRNLVFAPDRVTRYIPFAALFDGTNYLIENYAVSTIVSAKLTDTRDRLPPNPQDVSVLALGLSNSVPPDFSALPNVPVELDGIVKQTGGNTRGTFPGLKRLNQEFDWLTLQKNLYGHKILHIATHGKFIPGSFESSYLLLGTGKPLPIPQIEQLSDLVGVHLVVLSACETALGGKREQDGLEIAGISNSFLEQGAKTVLASLWQVNDASTSLLMQRFYQNLATGTMTKAEALRQAQRSLLQGSGQVSKANRSNFKIHPTQNGKPAVISRNLSHPYYWAPFILIGNGL